MRVSASKRGDICSWGETNVFCLSRVGLSRLDTFTVVTTNTIDVDDMKKEFFCFRLTLKETLVQFLQKSKPTWTHLLNERLHIIYCKKYGNIFC